MVFSVKLLTYLFVSTISNALAAPVENQIIKCTDKTTCKSESCNRTSAEVLKFIDPSINPCEDFYNFACGGYFKSHVIPEDQSEISQLYEINDVVYDQLRAALSEPIHEIEARPSKLVKKLFQLCSDTNTIERNGLNTIKSLIKSFGGWPVVEGEAWREDKFDWKQLMYKLRRSGLPIGHLLNTRIEQNVKDATKHIFVFDQSDLPVNRLNLMHGFNNSVIYAYYDYIVSLAIIHGADRNYTISEFKHFFEFLIELGKISVPPEELRNITAITNIMTIAEFKQRFPNIDWLEYINNIIALPEVTITDNDLVDVGLPRALGNLLKLLEKTPKRVIANYLITVSVASIGHTLNKVVKDNDLRLSQKLFGTTSHSARWRECVTVATQRMKVAVAALYSRKYFNEGAKKNVASIVNNLHKKFLEILEEIDWMDDETKNTATEKAKSIGMHIAYPQELLNDTILDHYYENLNSSDDYLQFVLNIQTFTSDKMYRSLIEPVSKSDWKDHSVSHEVNAFYHFTENSIVLPAAILQGVMFGNDRPNYMNYGSIGFVVGHEITHGFDDTGKQISKEGQLENWWTYDTEKSYTEKAQCIINQYSGFTSEELKIHLNGIITQGENIADNGGVKIAYDAYQEWVAVNSPEQCLPNLNYTPNQMFWISFANSWCTKERKEQLRSTMLARSHPPSMYRIYGVVINSKTFPKDFNCPTGSKMNPSKKCTFW